MNLRDIFLIFYFELPALPDSSSWKFSRLEIAETPLGKNLLMCSAANLLLITVPSNSSNIYEPPGYCSFTLYGVVIYIATSIKNLKFYFTIYQNHQNQLSTLKSLNHSQMITEEALGGLYEIYYIINSFTK